MSVDPMWDVFRERHPDVNLVILPAELPLAENQPEPGSEPADAAVSADEATAQLSSLSRRATLIAEVLGIEVRIASGFSRAEPTVVRGHVDASGIEPPAEQPDPGVLAHRLERLGWNTRLRPADDMVWIDLSASDATGRVVVSSHIASIRIDGPFTPVSAIDGDLLQEVRDV